MKELDADGGIAEAQYVEIGGLDQWLIIRGENRANPLLVVLHGGPGFSDTAFFRYYTPELEKAFTVVYWDQRGAGRSYNKSLSRVSMTIERFIADLDELVEWVCKRLDKRQVVILGHSWGSALGPLYAARFPAKVEAYVGVAQVGDWAASELASYAKAVAEAERQKNRGVLKKLRAIGPPPHDAKRLFVERTSAERLRGGLRPKALMNTLRMLLGTPEASVRELRATMRAFRFSVESMWAEVSQLNLIERVPALDVPVVIMLGRDDPWIPAEMSVAYFDALRARSKKLVWFEHSGHEPFVDESRKFVAAMLEIVRPLCADAPPLPADVCSEERRSLPGDDLLPNARAEVTHHIEIRATPADVWPWLVQMGRGRGGWYSWDLLDNGGRRSADHIVPELQQLAVGDVLPIKAKGSEGFAVLALEPMRALVLGDPSLLSGGASRDSSSPRATWSFMLEPGAPGATRLHVRVRADYPRSIVAWLVKSIVLAVHGVMERKQLETLKAHVERTPALPLAHAADSGAANQQPRLSR